ncbi:hypothetical protein J5U22_00687 [Saccharolobus shibatae]|uniref:Uncharacterized protein n=1 Tax=Saccharolobus shibatae TaxID=2286 RepID=A0A8F5GZ32_9CREN|nr:hypothetical protein J5U21_00782 [Saccharolobus shibatae]QXJ34142.1 hypothetical protein J5U22_00687 [Saccharolobus shibatae]
MLNIIKLFLQPKASRAGSFRYKNLSMKNALLISSIYFVNII